MSCAVVLHELPWEPGASTGCTAAKALAVLDSVATGASEARDGGIYSCDEFESSPETLRSKNSPPSVGCAVTWPARAG
jgi:hypothetical protein